MTEKREYNQTLNIKRWVAPTVISVLVFSLLTLASAISPILAVGLAICIVGGGVILLKLL